MLKIFVYLAQSSDRPFMALVSALPLIHHMAPSVLHFRVTAVRRFRDFLTAMGPQQTPYQYLFLPHGMAWPLLMFVMINGVYTAAFVAWANRMRPFNVYLGPCIFSFDDTHIMTECMLYF